MAKIGVFDSGKGGLSVVNAIKRELPNSEVLFVNDSKNMPYGSKTPDELYALVLPIFKELPKKVDVIVVACNTVSTTLIDRLRDVLDLPLIGMEPMVKPASEKTNSKIIAICATPTTSSSSRYAWLKQQFAGGVNVIEPDCTKWAGMIEGNKVEHQEISNQISKVCEQGADVIVLGCTHYHWIEEEIKLTATEYNATVLQPEIPVIKQLKRVLERLP